ncbi:MAG: hypothetical protein R3C05_00180 [Pirellulaceae bacterium]
MYDREQLTLIPTVRLNFPIASLQRRIAAGDPTIEMRDFRGRTHWDNNADAAALGPHYDPVHPAVQWLVQQLVDELIDRYASHKSFGGVALVIADDTCLQFPVGWNGENVDESVDMSFARTSMATKPSRDSSLSSTGKVQASAITELFNELGAKFEKPELRGKLYVVDEIRAGSMSHQAVRQSFLKDNHSSSNVIWVCSVAAAQGHRSSRRTADEEVDGLTALGNSLSSVKQHAILFRSENDIEIVGSGDRADMVSQIAASDADMIVHSLPCMTSGQLETRRDTFVSLQSLPKGGYAEVQSRTSKDRTVMVRTAKSKSATFGYVVNQSSWTTVVRLQFDKQIADDLQLATRASAYQVDGQFLQVRIEPFDVIAFDVSDSQANIVDWEVSRSPADKLAIDRWLDDVSRYINAAKDLQLQESRIVANADFNQINAKGVAAGWEISRGAGIVAQSTHDDSQSDRALSIRTETPRGWPTPPIGWVRSESFALPKSGRLLLVARARAEDDFATTRVKMVVTGRVGDRPHQQSVWIDDTNPTSDRPEHDQPTSSPYRQAGIQLLDMRSHVNDYLQIQFEVHHGGTAWIDQVSVYDEFLTSDEIEELETEIALVSAAIEKDNFGPYSRFHDSELVSRLMRHVPVEMTRDTTEVVASISDHEEKKPRIEAEVERRHSTVEPTISSRRNVPMASRPATTMRRSNRSETSDLISEIDEQSFGMIGSEAALSKAVPKRQTPNSVSTNTPSRNRTMSSPETEEERTSFPVFGKSESLDIEQDEPPKKSFLQRMTGWFRGKPQDEPDPTSSRSDRTERVSLFQR